MDQLSARWKKSAPRQCFHLAATLAISAAVPIYAQSLPANAQSPQISYVDCARVTEENSTMPDDRLGYAEDWSFYI